MTTVLVAEDEPHIARALQINLSVRGYEVITAPDGATALRLAAEARPDLVVLDLGLPDIDGIDVIAGLRGWTKVPIVVLSARTDSDSKVRSLDAGADDYITKPFGMDELLARLRVALRRAAETPSDDPIVDTGSFTVDLARTKVWRDGSEIHLTPTEWGLLEALVRNEGHMVTQKQLLQSVWGPEHDTDSHYLRVYVGQLRRKLEPDPASPRHLITELGMGYRFVRESPQRWP
jgi:two-component system KDP operon response regulator KdpE